MAGSNLLWFRYNAKDQIPAPDEAQQAVFDQGTEVGARLRPYHAKTRREAKLALTSARATTAFARALQLGVLLALTLALLGGCQVGAADARVTVRPPDNGEALVNPGMGWTLHFYSNFIENYGSKLEPSDTLDDWPGLSVIYLRVPWSFLEPKEGEFNWSLFDTPAQRWIAKGKKIAIRVSCSESWWRHATPKWIQDAGAKGVPRSFQSRNI